MNNENIQKEGFKAVAKSLVDFGYPDVTERMIEEAHGRWQRGEAEANIIDMMAGGQFDDYPQIFGTPANASV